MESLMSNILMAAARAKRPAEDCALDLTKPKFLRHTCDSLVGQEDLRLGTDSVAESYNHVKKEPRDSDVYDNPPSTVSCRKELFSRRFSFHSQQSTVQVKKEVEFPVHRSAPHPFSIEALLGDLDNKNDDKPSAPAVVYSSYTAKNLYTTVSEDSIPEFHVSYWCHVCNELCTDYKSAQGHQYLHYMQDAKCNLKKALFRQHGYVTEHVKLNDEKMKCGLCDKIVAQCFFTKHQRLHDGHFCDTCNHEFSTNSRLLDHMTIHTGSTPFSCKICNRKFAKRSSLTQHQRYHRDHQSFKCGYCPKSFNSKYARAVHERLHTGENPFKCQVPGCTRAFPQKIQLQLHMNTHK